jgi:hypothetical protein
LDERKPKLRADVDFTELALDDDSARLVSFMDGRLSVSELADLSGLPLARVTQVVIALDSQGALASVPAAGALAARSAPEPALSPTELPPEPAAVEQVEEDAGELADEPANEARRAVHRQLFETRLHHLSVEERMALAHQAGQPDEVLLALCFDPDPKVVRAIMENARAGLEHARLIAEHHRNPVGLEGVVARVELGRDAQVRRLLLRNQQASDAILRRILQPLALQKLFQVNLSRENTDRAKRLAREVFRQRWQQAQGEECAGLVFQTEGRCLQLLIGLHLDQAATAFLCRRTYTSSLLVQSLARFPATPPTLLKHLFQQALVRRAPHLKRLILQHPNCPGELKR